VKRRERRAPFEHQSSVAVVLELICAGPMAVITKELQTILIAYPDDNGSQGHERALCPWDRARNSAGAGEGAGPPWRAPLPHPQLGRCVNRAGSRELPPLRPLARNRESQMLGNLSIRLYPTWTTPVPFSRKPRTKPACCRAQQLRTYELTIAVLLNEPSLHR